MGMFEPDIYHYLVGGILEEEEEKFDKLSKKRQDEVLKKTLAAFKKVHPMDAAIAARAAQAAKRGK